MGNLLENRISLLGAIWAEKGLPNGKKGGCQMVRKGLPEGEKEVRKCDSKGNQKGGVNPRYYG